MVICKDVWKIYQQGEVKVEALRGVDLDIFQGEFVSLAGASGSGKTTLLNMIGGLDSVSSGYVEVDGDDLSGMNKNGLADLRLSKIGFVFQAYNLIPVLTAYENVEFIMQLQGVPAERRRELSHEILGRVGIADMGERKPAELSGGQQQRVAVARALVSNPSIILADEPTANLDSKTSESLLELMAELNQESQTTFIVATHDPQVIEFTKRKILISDGKVAQDC
ncbi:ABC transporter ATP-binding protein [Aliikangiella marina]|uniref:ABC transporter ATP-binding protein n=1 Tax=Aliikangiella marina TaxID=1712262 RepID=A0A545TEH4_9GAMM|nr:ABC transporter ATP-binding protein [Aliikangiella marina]